MAKDGARLSAVTARILELATFGAVPSIEGPKYSFVLAICFIIPTEMAFFGKDMAALHAANANGDQEE